MALRRLVRRHGDALIALALATVYVVELLRFPDAHLDVTLPLGVGACLALAVRRRAPLAIFVIVTVLNGAVPHLAQAFDANSISFVAVFIVNLYSLGAHARGIEFWLGAVGVAVSTVFATLEDGDTSPSGLFFFLVLTGLPWAVGVAFRLRRDKDRELREREQEARAETTRAVADERARIARELHDVVSHAIAVTVLQARGGRKLVGRDDDSVRRALRAIEETNTAALADMRRLLALLRESGSGGPELEPLPSLERLEHLVDHVRGSGVPVEFEVTGDPVPLPPGLELSAFRIVQEALTNVLKHGGAAARARVELAYGAEGLEVCVTNTGTSAAAVSANGGQGLIGIRERVAVAGGDVEVGPAPDGFAVRARLPYLLETS